MARLESSRDYIGAVEHPNTGDRVQLDESHSVDVAKTVADDYHFLSVAGESEDANTDDEAPAAEDDAEAETFRCGVNDCSRKVDSESATCWQH